MKTMNKHKRIATLALAAAMVFGMFSTAIAADLSADTGGRNDVTGNAGTSIVQIEQAAATQMTVTVPAILPISVDAQGAVTKATDAKVVNKSYGAVEVQDLAVANATGWTLVAGDHDFSKDKVGTKNYMLKIDGNAFDATTKKAAVSAALGAQIDGINASDSDERPFSYDAAISAQKTALSSEAIGTVTFTIDWAE